MQRTIQLILNKLVTTKFDVQVNSILKTSINCLCSLFKIKLLIFGPKKFVYYQSIRILHFQVDVLVKRSEASISGFAWASKFGSINAGSSINGGSIIRRDRL